MKTARLGRPPLPPGDRDLRIQITLSPEAVARLDATGNRSGAIERLVLEHLPALPPKAKRGAAKKST